MLLAVCVCGVRRDGKDDVRLSMNVVKYGSFCGRNESDVM